MPDDCGLLVEVKPADNEKLVRNVLRLADGRRVVLQSFDQANVRHAMRMRPGMPVAMLVDRPEQLDAALAGDWPEVNIDFALLDDLVLRRAREAGKSLGVWTVNEPADIRRALDAGVARMISDYPERAREAAR
jgi:glycerophosphoryl diester phosphodiesterase